jgi:transposase
MMAQNIPLPDDLDLRESMVRAMAEKTAILEDENAALKARTSDAPV